MENAHFKQAIEADDLNEFLVLCKDKWGQINTEIITEIRNYANTVPQQQTMGLDDCNALKYAVHCEATQIVSHLLSLPTTDPNPNCGQYGWPILGMACSKHRFDYAQLIINHPLFDFYRMAHLITLKPEVLVNGYFNEGKVVSDQAKQDHLEYIKLFLDKAGQSYGLWMLSSRLLEVSSHGEPYNTVIEECLKKNKLTLVELLEENQEVSYLLRVAYSKKLPAHLIESLTPNHFQFLTDEYAKTHENILLSFFMNENKPLPIWEDFIHKAPQWFKNVLAHEPVLFKYMNLKEIRALEPMGVSVWNEAIPSQREKKSIRTKGIDFIISCTSKEALSPRENEVMGFFLKEQLEQVVQRMKELNRDLSNYPLIQAALLDRAVGAAKPRSAKPHL